MYKNYRYTGEVAHNSTILVNENGRNVRRDLRLYPGEIQPLPVDHPVVVELVAVGLLMEEDILEN